jgi:cytoskeletal protein CcmA (bactofilin family)
LAYGDIPVSGPVSSWGFNVGGNVSSNQNITVDNNGKIIGDVSAAGTVTHTNGVINGTITQGAPPFTLTLPEIPTLVAQDVPYWQNLYKTEAQAGGTIFGDYTPPKGDVYLGPKYITGNVDMKNATVLHLTGTVYVEGWVSIKSKANIVGNGKLVAVGDIDLFNKLIGDPDSMPLLMTLGCFNMQNNGDLYAALYAPYCSIDVQNWNTVTGTVVAESVIGGQGFTANWDPKVRDIPGLPGGNVTEGNGTWIPVEQRPIIEYRGVLMDYYKVCDTESCD